MVPVFPGDVSGGSFYLDVESGLFFSRSFDILLISGCLVGSLVLLAIRFAVIPVLWPRIFRHFVEGSPTLEDLAPEKGKTVAELRGGIERRQVNFLFGHADRELVEKWGKIAQGIAALSRSRKRLAIWAAGIFLAWPAAVFFLSGGWAARWTGILTACGEPARSGTAWWFPALRR